MRGQRNIYHANGYQKKARVAILMSENIDFRTKTVTRDKGGHYIIIKWTIQHEDTIVNIYTPKVEYPNTKKTIKKHKGNNL